MTLFSDMSLKNMRVLGIGTDICNMTRIEKLYHRFQDKFLTRIFSQEECDYFYQLADKKKVSFLAKRFAAKEALAKALQTGIGHQAYFTEISCLNDTNHAPNICLTGKTHHTALMLARNNNYGTYQLYISLSDDTHYALAFIIITGITE